MAFPHTDLDGNLSPSKLAKDKKLVIHQLSLFTNANFSNDQKLHSFFVFGSYRVSKLSMGRIPSKRCIPTLVGKRFQRMTLIQQFLVSHFHQITCGSILAALTPLSALLDLFLVFTCHICQMEAFRYYWCHRCHSILIIVVMELRNLVQVSHQLENDSFSPM